MDRDIIMYDDDTMTFLGTEDCIVTTAIIITVIRK